MPPQTLTTIVSIKQNHMLSLQDILYDVHNPYRSDNPYLRLSPKTHFVRFVIIPGADENDVIYPGDPKEKEKPGEEKRRYRLLIWAVFDESPEEFINYIVNNSPNMDAIWAECENYAGATTLYAYLTDPKHLQPVQVNYATFPEETVDSIQRKNKTRQAVENILKARPDKKTALPQILKLSVKRTPDQANVQRNLMVAIAFVAVIVILLIVGVLWLFSQNWPAAVVLLIILGTIGLLIYNWLKVVVLDILKKSKDPFTGTLGALKDQLAERSDERIESQSAEEPKKPARVRAREDQIAQNQFNLYLTFKDDADPRARRVMRMRLIMLILNLSSRYLLPPGVLGGLTTVHFGQWLLIDNGKRLFFMTCYDGSWENYIADFVNKIYPTLDIQLWNFVGFSDHGTRDIAAFRRWLRRVQIQSDVFYSGYPDLRVRNIAHNRKINDTFPNSTEEAEKTGWIELL